MPHFDWRSSETYDRTRALEPAGFAWECLRRNPEYQRDYLELSYSEPDPAMITTFRRRWGLSFRC
jgi:hypothetical protein